MKALHALADRLGAGGRVHDAGRVWRHRPEASLFLPRRVF
ncbi:hypothetical protein JCM13580A_18180 [Streptomyces drozdowiczii]